MVVVLHVPQLQILPMEWRVYGLQITWMIMRSLLLGACGVAIAIGWHTARTQIFAIIMIGGVGFMAFVGMEHYLLTPIHGSLTHDVRANGIIKQTSDSSCAPAALATVLRQWGINASEPEVAQLAGTSRMGTSMPQLITAAQKLGMDGLELRPSWEAIQKINRPGILSIWLVDGNRRLPHAVALLGISQNTAIIADPADGKAYSVDRATLENVWRHEYVPIFRSEDILLLSQEARHYLAELGYISPPQSQGWPQSEPSQSQRNDLKKALRQFQQDTPGLKRTGTLEPETILALTGPFIKGVPVLTYEDESDRSVSDYHHIGT
ncbi:MAG: hypothetical protein F6K09_09810 [Merismopedia sp. SIO2A8]|nr:hypothetical protein [Merismopedia sp. SIO2A8]